MNKFYKLLIYFCRGERIARSFLLRKPNITEELIEKAIDDGYIREIHNAEHTLSSILLDNMLQDSKRWKRYIPGTDNILYVCVG